MNDESSLRDTIEPKSDQLNADDLIGTTKTVKITDVRRGESADQPVSIHYEGDNGRPYKPCKSMRRVMIHAWGDNGREWVGRRMTLYQDPEVKFGGVKVGGIRISHLSDIDKTLNISLTQTRGKRAPYTVEPLRVQAYPADQLKKNLPAWEKAIKAGKMTPDQVIEKAEGKGALTDEQKRAVRACAEEPEPGDDAVPDEEGAGNDAPTDDGGVTTDDEPEML